MGKLEVITHPLIQHKLSILRRTDTSTKAFRELVNEIAMLMGYEVLRASGPRPSGFRSFLRC